MGVGSDTLYDEKSNVPNSNIHQGSKRIIIVGLPKEYIFPKGTNYGDESESAFFGENAFHITEEDALIDDKPRKHTVLMPEFVVGCYDANSKTFTQNEGYYKNLDKEKQAEVLERVKQNYIKYLKERFVLVNLNSSSSFDIRNHMNFMLEIGQEIPLSKEELRELDDFSRDVKKNPDKYKDYIKQQEGSEQEDESMPSPEKSEATGEVFNANVDMSWLEEFTNW